MPGMVDDSPLPWILCRTEALAVGITAQERRGPGYVRVRRGAWVVAGTDTDDVDVRIAAVAAQLPVHAGIGGWSAARLHERTLAHDDLVVFDGSVAWEERRHRQCPGDRGPAAARVLVYAEPRSRLVVRPDVRVLRSALPPADVGTACGVRVTFGDRTAFDMARLLPEARAVVALDRLLHLGIADATGVGAVVARSAGWLGVPAARHALSQADGRAESPQESLMRLLWVAAGFPRPMCNRVVRTAEGRFVARVDLIDDVAGVVGEYDGSYHASSSRRRSDARRQEDLEDTGLVVVRAMVADLSNGGAGPWQRRLRAAYARAASRTTRRWVVTPT